MTCVRDSGCSIASMSSAAEHGNAHDADEHDVPLCERADARASTELTRRRHKHSIRRGNASVSASASTLTLTNAGEEKKGSRNMKQKAPPAVSAKKPTGGNLGAPPMKRKRRDPRFDPLASKTERDIARKRMAFVYDEQLPAERSNISKQLKRSRSEYRKNELRLQLSQLNQRLEREQERRDVEKAKRESKEQEKAAVRAGKHPFYPKKRHIREKALSYKYERLKKQGKLSKYLTRRRQKIQNRDAKKLPERRSASATGAAE